MFDVILLKHNTRHVGGCFYIIKLIIMQEEQGSIIVSNEVYAKLPGVMLVTGKAKVTTDKINNESIQQYLQDSWVKLQSKVTNESSEESSRVQQWCDALKQAGVPVKDYPPSIKAIAKRALKGGEPFSINPIVDTYNAISMDLALPFGAYDTATLAGELRIRLSAGGENFMALGSEKNEPNVSGEIVFADDANILTRMFLWRQSHNCKITEDTNEFIYICEIAGSMGMDMAHTAQQLIHQKLSELLGAEISNSQIQTASSQS